MTSQRTEIKVIASNRMQPVHLTPYPPPPNPAPATSPSSFPLLGTSNLNPVPAGFTPSQTPNNSLPANFSSAAGTSITPLHSCVSVLSWVQYVIAKLHDIQWRQIGTESGTGRPLFEMVNPNAVIEEIYQRYFFLFYFL